MKNAAFSLCTFLLVALSFTACQKDVQKAFDEEISATWASQSVKVDASDVSSVYTFNIALRDDHTFTLKTTTRNPFTQATTTNTNTGNWSSDEATQAVTLNFDNAPTQSWKISNLSGSGMTAQYTDETAHKYEIAFAR
jgi:hypothetical protein